MKFRELPRKWKIQFSLLSLWTGLSLLLLVGFTVFLQSYRASNQAHRAVLVKPDSQLIGERLVIERPGKEPVRVNLYRPSEASQTPLPLVVNVHGGGFVGGDADVYQRRQIDLSQIDISVLSCGNWGGNALHLRGNTEGYLAIPSTDKLLEIHGLEHFTEFYTDYGRTMQQAFLDYYLKGKGTWHQAPVHLRLRNVDGSFTDRDEQEWPLARTQWTKYYLQKDGSLSVNANDDFQLSFQAASEGLNFFTEPLTEEFEITGPAAASLLVSSSTQDADIFITLRVLDSQGNDVSFVAVNDPHGVGGDRLAKGISSQAGYGEKPALPSLPYAR